MHPGFLLVPSSQPAAVSVLTRARSRRHDRIPYPLSNLLIDLIISHKHKFIFFAVPKTATHAVRQALRPNLAQGDWEQQTLFGEQFLPISELAAMGHGHISVRQLLQHLSSEVWESYFKFAFVRNPFDRFVSTCFFLNRKNPQFEESAITFMKSALNVERFRKGMLVLPQNQLLINDDGNVVLDAVGRYESLQVSYDEICSRIGIPTTELGRKNPSSHDAYVEYYDDELRDRVATFYEDDLRMFSYDFDSCAPMS